MKLSKKELKKKSYKMEVSHINHTRFLYFLYIESSLPNKPEEKNLVKEKKIKHERVKVKKEGQDRSDKKDESNPDKEGDTKSDQGKNDDSDQDSDKSKMKLDDILQLENISDQSNLSENDQGNEKGNDFLDENDDIKAMMMEDDELDDDLSETSESDEEKKKDPCFKEMIALEWVREDSHDFEDYETLKVLIEDVDKLSQDSSEMDEDIIPEVEGDLDSDEDVIMQGKKSKKDKKFRRNKGPRFIPLPDNLRSKYGKKTYEKRQAKQEERMKQIERATLQANGMNARTLENEAFGKIIKEIVLTHNEGNNVVKSKQDNNTQHFIRKLKDLDSFEDIMTHLASLSPALFTGEFKKVKTCALWKHRDFQSELSFYLNGFQMTLNKEAAQLRVLYIKYDSLSSKKMSFLGEKQFDDYERYNIPFMPDSYKTSEIRDIVLATQTGFDHANKKLVLADLSMNVQLNCILTNQDIMFELKEGEKKMESLHTKSKRSTLKQILETLYT